MSDSSLILSLPYIQPAQAQKHVTHNEAIRTLDVIVQPTVTEVGRTDPPQDPAQGARYVVGPGGRGDWTGLDGSIAVWEDSGWTVVVPAAGWTTRATDTLIEWVYDGSTWILPGNAVETLGVNTTADSTNRLAVSGANTLLSHEGAGHQLKINKADTAETASLLYQSNWSGRAEMGLAGSDNFSVKVSADGTTWFTELEVDGTSGMVSFPSGAHVPHHAELGGRWIAYSDQRWVTLSRAHGAVGDAHAGASDTGADPALTWLDTGLYLRAGTRVETLMGRLRADGAEAADLTSYSLRLYFQHGPDTPDGDAWNTDAETTRALIFGVDDAPLSEGWRDLTASFAAYTAPDNGSLVIYLKPGGSYGADQQIVSEIVVGYTQ